MMAALHWVAPEFIRPLYQTRPGALLLLVMVCLLATGLYVISRIVSIPLD
jgi:Flp pilus assembly protein TadB